MVSSRVSAARQSASEIRETCRKIRKGVNATWALAPKAPMFTRKSTSENGKRKSIRTFHLIGGHAYRIAASGGASFANAALQQEAKTLRMEVGKESKRCPWLPSVSSGAKCMLEGFLCAYAQEATRNAVSIREGIGSHKRLNGKLMKLGFEVADASIFGTSCPAPRDIIVTKPLKKNKEGKKIEDDNDWEPPPEADADA